eukprot:gene12240-biopygen10301
MRPGGIDNLAPGAGHDARRRGGGGGGGDGGRDVERGGPREGGAGPPRAAEAVALPGRRRRQRRCAPGEGTPSAAGRAATAVRPRDGRRAVHRPKVLFAAAMTLRRRAAKRRAKRALHRRRDGAEGVVGVAH